MSYLTPSGPHEIEIVVKNSRFIARTSHVESREEAMYFVSHCQTLNPDAGHHCWAYIIGPSTHAKSAGSSDDGEPAGTAGKPIFNVIQHQNMGHIVVVVSRYFGGIKLGAGGLIRAYSRATSTVLQGLITQPVTETQTVRVIIDFSQEHSLRHIVNQLEGQLDEPIYSENIECHCSLPKSNVQQFIEYAQANQWIYEGLDKP